MMRLQGSVLLLLFVACASVLPEDERLDVDASLAVEAAEVAHYRVIIKNSSEDPLTVERVEVLPFGSSGGSGGTRAFVVARELIPPGNIATFTVTSETNVRDLRRTAEEIGGPADISTTRGRIGKRGARIYVTFSDGMERKTASYKVEL